jgi:probable F420-dependent oxidoreductase
MPQISIGLSNWADAGYREWDRLLDRARAADRAGIDRVVVSDHVVLGENLEAYGRPELGGTEGGRQPTGPDGQWLEPLTVLAVLAGVTGTVRLGTNILLAALRRPVVLAKAAATLDVLSGGRLDLGVGVGWQREEYLAAGLEFERRGRLLDHTLEVCRTLWSEAPAGYDSPELTFEKVYCSPRPVRPGGIPLWISGTANRRAARRLARFGAGWIPWGPAAADLHTGIAEMGELVAREGGDLGSMQIVGTLRISRDEQRRIDLDRTMAAVPDLAAAGVTDFRALLRVPDEPDAALELLAPLVAAFRDATA